MVVALPLGALPLAGGGPPDIIIAIFSSWAVRAHAGRNCTCADGWARGLFQDVSRAVRLRSDAPALLGKHSQQVQRPHADSKSSPPPPPPSPPPLADVERPLGLHAVPPALARGRELALHVGAALRLARRRVARPAKQVALDHL
eukprot:4478369-Prymnesium_polylepis.1